jgi:putative protein kinase ArgK-like GTPase of G3E family
VKEALLADKRSHVVCITGQPGVGKSTLANTAANELEYKGHFSKVIRLSLHNQTSKSTGLTKGEACELMQYVIEAASCSK